MAKIKRGTDFNKARRQESKRFKEIPTTAVIGPSQKALFKPKDPVQEIITWSVAPEMTEDLQSAIIEFIDKNKEGAVVLPQIARDKFKGRTKVIEFEYTGEPSNTYKFGEIGVVKLILSYPPGANINKAKKASLPSGSVSTDGGSAATS